MAANWVPLASPVGLLPNAYTGVPYSCYITYSPNGTAVSWVKTDISWIPTPAIPATPAPTTTLNTSLAVLPGDVKPFILSGTFSNPGIYRFKIEGFNSSNVLVYSGEWDLFVYTSSGSYPDNICGLQTTQPQSGTVFNGYVGFPFSQDIIFDFLGSGLSPGFALVGGAPLPPGLTLIPALPTGGNSVLATISGTPTTPGTYEVFFSMEGGDTPPIPSPFTCQIGFIFNISADPPPPPFPNPANLRFFDNANVVPAPQGVTAPFNDEPANVWLGWDAENCMLCITNYNRLIIICCFTPTPQD